MNQNLKGLFIVLIIVLGLIFSFRLEFFAGLENFLEDSLFIPRDFHPDIVILAIDNESIKQIGQWPWPRKIFAEALKKIEKYQPSAVGIDVIFSEESRFGSDDDKILSQILKNVSYPFVLPTKADSLIIKNKQAWADSFTSPLKIFTPLETKFLTGISPNAVLGHVNLILDSDAVVRRFPVYINKTKDQEKVFAFSYLIAKKTGLEIPLEDSPEPISRIVFAAPTGAISRIPFERFLSEELPLPRLKNKIILIGSTAVDLHDEKLTPLSRGTAMQGVEIQANILNMFLKGYSLKSLCFGLTSLWIFLVGLFCWLVFLKFKDSLKFLLINFSLGIFWLVLMLFLIEEGFVPNLIHLNSAWIFSTLGLFSYRYFTLQKEKQEIKKVFSRYVSREVLEEILKNPAKVSLGGEEKFITILFSDIRGFTSLSEKLPVKTLVKILNRYFTLMSEEILKQRGIVDKYIGDAIMAFWGAPLEDKEQADHALRAGLAMGKQLKILNNELKQNNLPELNIGIGIYSGPAVVGNVGSENRFNYTAIGDSVNIASRIEGLTKTYGVKIIISESVKNKLKENYSLEFLGTVEIRGRQEPVKIYQALPETNFEL